MLQMNIEPVTMTDRKIIHTTHGRKHGPVTRLVSPGDLGELIKPFVFVDIFDMETVHKEAFGFHPHSGIATVTTIFQGDTVYEDSTGKKGQLNAGGVEWMKAGDGVWHAAAPTSGGRVYGYQLWLALPEAIETTAAESRYINPADVPKTGPARVILGSHHGVSSPLPQLSPLTYLHVRLSDGEAWTFDPPAGHDVLWFSIDSGAVEVAGRRVADEIAVFEEGSGPVSFRAHGEVNLMLGSAAKHPHPLVTGYYSVHTNPSALQIGERGIAEIGRRLKADGKV